MDNIEYCSLVCVMISRRNSDVGGGDCFFSAAKKNRAVSDDDNSDSDAGSDAPDKSMAAKLRELGSDSEDEEDKDGAEKKDEKTLFGSDSDSGDEEE